MLTSQDDLIGHQTPQPFAKSAAGDPRFTERYWYTAHPIDGTELLLDVGLGYYPNRHVMDGFAGVTVGRRQHNFRASRRLGARPLDTSVGALKIEIIEGMRQHRLSLSENPSGISFSLDFEATFPPAQEKQNFRERDGVVEEDLARVSQFGRWRGWIKADVGVQEQNRPAVSAIDQLDARAVDDEGGYRRLRGGVHASSPRYLRETAMLFIVALSVSAGQEFGNCCKKAGGAPAVAA